MLSLLCCCYDVVLFVCWGSQGLQFVPALTLPRLASQKDGFGAFRINFNTLLDVIRIDSSRTFSIAIVYMRCIALRRKFLDTFCGIYEILSLLLYTF